MSLSAYDKFLQEENAKLKQENMQLTNSFDLLEKQLEEILTQLQLVTKEELLLRDAIRRRDVKISNLTNELSLAKEASDTKVAKVVTVNKSVQVDCIDYQLHMDNSTSFMNLNNCLEERINKFES